jgi:hypothetical protein
MLLRRGGSMPKESPYKIIGVCTSLSYILYVVFYSANDFATCNWFNGYSLLNKAVKEFSSGPGSSAIKSEGKFIQIVIKMRCLHSPLVSSQEPPFQQRNNSVSKRQKVLAYRRILADHIMSISEPIQSAVSGPVIGPNYTARHHHSLDCFTQALCRSIRYAAKTNASNPVPVLLGRDQHQNLSSGPATTLTRFTAANIGFINFHGTSKVIPARADHGATQLMQPGPRGTIAPKPQNTLKAQCTDPRLLIDYVPHRLKPKFQRFPGILKNGPCSYGGLKITRSASIQTTVHDPKSFKTTPWTSKTFRPSQSRQIIDTGLFRGKFFFKFLHSSGIFLHKREYYI